MEITTKEIPHEIYEQGEYNTEYPVNIPLNEYITGLEDRIKELESKICEHNWQDSFVITEIVDSIPHPDGGNLVQKRLIPIKVCMNCFILRQNSPEEIADLQKEMNDGIILPGDPRGNILDT